MGWAALIATQSSAWYDFVPPFLVAGGRDGMRVPAHGRPLPWRDIEPRNAGAASGLLNTNRQVGSVIGASRSRLRCCRTGWLPPLPSQAPAALGGASPARSGTSFVAGVHPAPRTPARWARARAPASHPQHGIPAPTGQTCGADLSGIVHPRLRGRHAPKPIVLPIAVLAVAALSLPGDQGRPRRQPAQPSARNNDLLHRMRSNL